MEIPKINKQYLDELKSFLSSKIKDSDVEQLINLAWNASFMKKEKRIALTERFILEKYKVNKPHILELILALSHYRKAFYTK